MAPVAAAIEGLITDRANPANASELALFGRLVGDWDLLIENRQDDGQWMRLDGEWHFGWILNGRAIQDVWIAYKPGARRGDPDGYAGYGTTVRVYDAKERVWHVNWMGVLNHNYTRFRARQIGTEIVMDAKDDDGRPMQWIFSEVTNDRFMWRAQDSADGGKTWNVIQKMTAMRRKTK